MGTNREEKWESIERKNGNQLKAKEFILDLCKNYLKYKNDKMKKKKRKKKKEKHSKFITKFTRFKV